MLDPSTLISEFPLTVKSPITHWLFLFGVLLCVIILRRVISRFFLYLICHISEKISVPIGQPLREALTQPVQAFVLTTTLLVGLSLTALPAGVELAVSRVLVSFLIIAVFGIWYQLAEVFVSHIGPAQSGKIRLEQDWALRVLRFMIVIAGFAVVLQHWDLDIGSALTGVGVLGAAAALASQDLLRNLMGGMSNMSEERFRTGDWIEIEGLLEGTVSKVSLRSTTVIGFDRVPYYVPNSVLSDRVVRNKARRDHRRLYWPIHIDPATKIEKLESLLEGIQTYLDQSRDFHRGESFTNLTYVEGFSNRSIQIIVYAYTETNDFSEFSSVSNRLSKTIIRLMQDLQVKLVEPLAFGTSSKLS